MDAVTLRQYETLSPFEIKNDLAKVATKTAKASQVAYLNAGRGNPNWVATEPRSAFFLLGQFAVTESQRTMQLLAGIGGMPKAPGIAGAARGWLEAHADMPGAELLRQCHPLGGEDLRFQRRRLRARAGRLDHRRQLSGAGSHARAQRTDRSRVPAVGDVRRAPAGRDVRPVRGRGRHRGDVLPLQVAQGEPAAQPRRHHRDGDADLHAVPRDAAPRGLRPEDRQHPGPAGAALAVHRCRIWRRCSTPRSRPSSSSIPATRTPWRSAASRSRRSAGSCRSVRISCCSPTTCTGRSSRDSDRCSASFPGTPSASTPTASTSVVRAGAWASSRCTSTTSSTRRLPRIRSRSRRRSTSATRR